MGQRVGPRGAEQAVDLAHGVGPWTTLPEPIHRAVLAFIVVGLCGIGLAKADEAEGRAVAAIKKLGGTFKQDDSKPGKPVVALDQEISGLDEARKLNRRHRARFMRSVRPAQAGRADLSRIEAVQVTVGGSRPECYEGIVTLGGMGCAERGMIRVSIIWRA